ncbi:MAG: oligosaccharide repeat unit polymerase [Crocinitomicaceae bacterium]|nr:oligosaccharide repeat unit polymerase [Crocinitomicaceae bacterium]
MDNLRESRTLLKFGSGLFSRVILHGIPILAGIFICIYFERKNKYYLIIPALSLLIILLTGYRGFVIWTLLYFMMISNRFKRIKIYNAKIGFALLFILSFSVFLTKQYFTNSTYEVAASKFIERVFISNVYGYNILLNNYMDTHNIGVTEVSDLPSDLFTYEFGSGGYLVDLGAELTVTLPGMSYALGGYLLTVLFAIFIGSISGYLERKNLNSTDALHIAVRTFVLFSFITLINRGYIFNFLTIAMVSLVFVYVLILVSSKKKFVHHV